MSSLPDLVAISTPSGGFIAPYSDGSVRTVLPPLVAGNVWIRHFADSARGWWVLRCAASGRFLVADPRVGAPVLVADPPHGKEAVWMASGNDADLRLAAECADGTVQYLAAPPGEAGSGQMAFLTPTAPRVGLRLCNIPVMGLLSPEQLRSNSQVALFCPGDGGGWLSASAPVFMGLGSGSLSLEGAIDGTKSVFTLTVMPSPPGHMVITLLSGHGKYLSPAPSGAAMADKKEVGVWEQLRVEGGRHQGTVNLGTCHGTYLGLRGSGVDSCATSPAGCRPWLLMDPRVAAQAGGNPLAALNALKQFVASKVGPLSEAQCAQLLAQKQSVQQPTSMSTPAAGAQPDENPAAQSSVAPQPAAAAAPVAPVPAAQVGPEDGDPEAAAAAPADTTAAGSEQEDESGDDDDGGDNDSDDESEESEDDSSSDSDTDASDSEEETEDEEDDDDASDVEEDGAEGGLELVEGADGDDDDEEEEEADSEDDEDGDEEEDDASEQESVLTTEIAEDDGSAAAAACLQQLSLEVPAPAAPSTAAAGASPSAAAESSRSAATRQSEEAGAASMPVPSVAPSPPPPAPAFATTHVYVFHDGENCAFLRRCDYNVVMLRNALQYLALGGTPPPGSPPPFFRWNCILGSRSTKGAEDYSPNDRVKNALVTAGVHLIDAGTKAGTVDVVLKEQVRLHIEEHEQDPPEMRARSCVILLSSDRDFASDVRYLRRKGFRTGIVCRNEGVADSYVQEADFRGSWDALLEASRIKTAPKESAAGGSAKPKRERTAGKGKSDRERDRAATGTASAARKEQGDKPARSGKAKAKSNKNAEASVKSPSASGSNGSSAGGNPPGEKRKGAKAAASGKKEEGGAVASAGGPTGTQAERKKKSDKPRSAAAGAAGAGAEKGASAADKPSEKKKKKKEKPSAPGGETAAAASSVAEPSATAAVAAKPARKKKSKESSASKEGPPASGTGGASTASSGAAKKAKPKKAPSGEAGAAASGTTGSGSGGKKARAGGGAVSQAGAASNGNSAAAAGTGKSAPAKAAAAAAGPHAGGAGGPGKPPSTSEGKKGAGGKK